MKVIDNVLSVIFASIALNFQYPRRLYLNSEIHDVHCKHLFSGVRGQVSNIKSEPLPKGSVTSISTSTSTIHSHEQQIKLFKSARYSRILPPGNFELKASAPGISSIFFCTVATS